MYMKSLLEKHTYQMLHLQGEKKTDKIYIQLLNKTKEQSIANVTITLTSTILIKANKWPQLNG